MFKCIKLKFLLALLLIMSPLSSANAEAYCATVKIEIKQELSLERQAFDAVMKINNGLDTLSIEDVSISVNFADEDGIPVLATNDPNETNPDAKFFIRVDSMTGINNVEGAGIVAPATSAEIRWLIIPIPGSAGGLPGGKLYFVGAHLTYTLGGVEEVVDVEPDFITVKPLPQLALDYFLTQEVIGDDAFTPAVEAPEPYTLGVRIQNKGTGIANNIKIDSAQPKIVENEQGLLIDFKITGSTLNDKPSTPSLLIDFGVINPGKASVGRWIMETSLSGKFTEFTAKVSHADELGGAVTSIIDTNDINTHFLLRDVRVDLPGRDFVRDFLATPAGTSGALNVYESDTVDTAVNNASASATFPLINANGTQVVHRMNMTVAGGFVYTRVSDPYNGQKVITNAVRSDGKVMLLDNVWPSKTRNRDTSPPSWEYWVNVFDVNSTGNYTITMGDLVIGPLPPVIQVVTDKVTHEDKQVGFIVESTDPNGDSVSLIAEPLPVGATFVDNGDGTAFFNWTPSVGQAGTYLITYKASDGVLTSKRTATIRVNPANDTDGDGLDDAWELDQFGSLDQDGTGDSDGDGISDLDEFLNGTDPNLAPPPAPNDLTGTSGNLQVYLSWSDVAGATDYRVYWSETPNVSKELSELIDGVLSPFAHTGLINNKPYYYALTSVGPGGESGLSAEIEVIPGNKNWGIPGAVENSANDILEYQVANANNDTAIAVWTENDTLHTNVWASVYAIDTGWATPQLIELSDTADASAIRVKMDNLGNAIVLWKQTDATTESLWSNTYTAGTWNTPLQITGADAGELGQAEIILTNSGAAMAAWLQADAGQTQMSTVWASLLFSNASAWNTAVLIDSALSDEVSGLQIANDGLGNVMAVWSQTLDSGSSYNFAFNRFTNSAWGVDQLIRSGMVGDVTAPVVKPVMAVNQQGDAVIAWAEVNTVNSVMAMRFTIAAGWDVASLVEFDDVNPAYDPSVAISDTGDAITVWTQSNTTQDAIYSNRYKPLFGWEPNTLMLSSSATGDPIGVASVPKVEMDTTGNVVVVWQQTDSVQTNIWSNRYDLITGWEGSMIIDYLNDGDAINPVVTMDTTGNAVALWIYNNGVTRDLLFNDLNASNTGMPNILPVVKIPADLTVNENDAVVIDGSSSFDQDGFIALYEWSQVSGTPVVLDATNGIYTHTLNFAAPSLPAPETLVFRLSATDGDNAVGTRDVAVFVNAQSNIPPTVDAGLDQSVNEQTTVTLTGVASDSDGSIATYTWTQTSGAAVTLTGADASIATFTSPIVSIQDGPQVLSFLLTVTDDKGETATDAVDVTVNPVNAIPTVNAGVDQTVNEQTPVTLTGTATDTDGTIATYVWTQTSGVTVTLTGANSATASFTSPVVLVQDGAQVLSFTLTATDNEGAVITDNMTVTVNPVNAAPTANAGVDQTVDEQAPVALTGTATDSDGSITGYTWTQTGGETVTLTGANTAVAVFTSPIVLAQDGPQVLSFTLTATDNEGAVITDSMTVTVNPVNAAPTANAGVDQTVDEQTPVTLTGTATDTDGSIATYAWTQTSGIAVTLTGANTAVASFTSPIVLVQDGAQVLSFTLTATDNEGSVVTDAMTVTVNPVNAAPTANAGVDQTVDEQTPVTLTGTATDTDGSIATYVWTQTSGVTVTLTGANTATANFTAPIVLVQDGPQVLSFTLTATDNEGSVVTDTMTVTVNPVNAAPTANAGVDQTVDEQTPVTLTGTATDTDGSIATYVWTQTGGVAVTLTGANTATANFTAPIVLVQDGPQVLSFTLTATDNEGSVVTDTMTVTVNPVNAAPTANAGVDQTVDEQTPVTLTGTATDTDGSIATYVWTQTGGVAVTLTGANTATANFTAPIVLVQDGPQVLSFTLTATDNEGSVVTDAMTVTVNPVNATPTANAGVDQTVNEQTPVTLTGTATDTDGTIATYVWTQTGGVTVTLTGANTATANFTAPIVLVQDGPQVLSFTLTATDNEGSVVTDAMTVTVNPVNATPTANAGVDQTVNEQTPVTLTGTATDTDGTIATYVWTQTGGVAVTLTGANTTTADFTSPVVLVQDGAQVLSFTLTATDNEGSVVTDAMSVTVNPVNAAPTANAGVDQTVNEQTPVTLTGTATDTDGTIATYAWTQTSGIAVTLTGANTATANFTAPIVLVQDGAQVLSFTLTATDNEGSVVTDTMTVIVNPVNAAPTANAGVDQTVNEQTPVTLTGTATDTDGSIATYVWTQTSGVIVTLTGAHTESASFTAPIVLVQDGAQVLSFTLTATDNEGSVVTDAMTVTVNPVNATPTANAGVDQTVNEQTPVTLTGTATDTDGTIATYVWTQTSGIAVTLTGAHTESASFTAPIVLVQDGAQVLSFTLTATDNEGAVVTDAMTVTVNPVNAAPTANAGVDQTVDEQTPVTLIGTATDTDGSIATYVWTQTGGVTVTLTGANTASASFTSPVVLVQDGPQVLSFTLTATDNEGSVVTDTMTVTVNPVNAGPTVDAGIDQSKAEGTLVQLLATASDSDGTIASYSWTQSSGPSVVLTAADTANANFMSPLVYQDTSLVFQVLVTDNEGTHATDTIRVVVYSTNPDDDADGMDDLWEVGQFGDMTRDGNGDFDNDGFSDYQEYQQGTNPLVYTLPAPTGLKAVAYDSQVTLSWVPVDGAVAYNLYWSTSPGVTSNSGNLIPNVSSGFVHTGLTNGTSYYYVVTALSAEDESVVSEEAGATPGIRAWNASQRIDSGTVTKATPQIAINADGYAVSIWSQFDGVAYSAWVNHRDPDMGWGVSQAIETGNNGNIYNPQVAINDNGNAIAVWEQFDGVTYNVWSNRYDPLNGWSTAERIETNSLDGGVYFYPQVAMDENGNAIAVWQKFSGSALSIWANRYDSALGWQTAQVLETNNLHHAYDPQVAIDSSGNALVVWEQFDGMRYNIYSNRYDEVANIWSSATIIDSSDLGSAYDAKITMDAQGNAVAVWEQFDGTRYNVWSNYYTASTGWATANYVEYNANGGSVYFHPQVAMDDHGNAVSVWQQFDGVKVSIWANRLVNGVWGTATVVEPIDYAHSFNPQVAIDSDGNAVVVWEQPDNGANTTVFSVWTNRYSIYDGSWLQPRPLETIDTALMLSPQVAMDDYGNTVTIWWASNKIRSATDGLAASVPFVDAGLDQIGNPRDLITLNASASYDPAGQALSYHWHQLSGIETALNGKTTSTVTLQIPNDKNATSMQYILTITNADGITMTDTVVVSIEGRVLINGQSNNGQSWNSFMRWLLDERRSNNEDSQRDENHDRSADHRMDNNGHKSDSDSMDAGYRKDNDYRKSGGNRKDNGHRNDDDDRKSGGNRNDDDYLKSSGNRKDDDYRKF